MRKFLAALALAGFTFITPSFSQTINHAQSTGQGTSASVGFSNVQNVGDTNIVGAYPPGGVLTDSAGDVYTQDCVFNGMAIFHSTNIITSPSNVITYTIPTSNYIGILTNEQKGSWVLDSCGRGSGSSPGVISASPDSSTQSGDLIYALLNSTSCCIGTSLEAGFSALNGLADTWYGPNFYSGWVIDEIGTPTTQGASFTYRDDGSVVFGNIIMAAFKSAAPPPANVVLNINTGSAAVYDDQTPILPGSITISQQQNSTTTNTIGTIISDSAGNLTGSLTVNPNWTDANGNLTFLFGLPIAPNLLIYPVPVGELQHGSTGLTINLVLFKQGPLAVKSQTLAVTP